MNKPPAFQFYADDFLGGTAILSTEEIGAYILLLCHQWNTGSIPDDDNLIRRIAKVTQAFDLGLVKAKFQSVDGVLKNARMEHEREKQRLFREKQAQNGAKGGRPKTQAFPKPNPTPNPNESSPSPSPSPKEDIAANADLPLGKVSKPKAETNPEVRKVVAWYCDGFLKHKGVKFVADGRHGKAVKEFLAASGMTAGEVAKNCEKFWTCGEFNCLNAQKSLQYLMMHWNEVITEIDQKGKPKSCIQEGRIPEHRGGNF
jgi:uncharacterized protein YdaU (DUF1376 family)